MGDEYVESEDLIVWEWSLIYIIEQECWWYGIRVEDPKIASLVDKC